jgi:hypothetical protein
VTVALGKMTSQVAAIVKDASHLDYAILAAAIEKEMSRLLHLMSRSLWSGSATGGKSVPLRS